ncbi:MAG: DUF58 domain-containing protein [Opitutales bacterium]
MDDKVSQMLKKVRQIEIRTNRQVSDALAGSYHSVFKGRGMDFEESREYQVGDDIRSIDWNVTARTNKAHIKLFKEERELTIMLLVDLSASGLFGSVESKREKMAEIASCLAFSASYNNDKVGLALFTDKVELLVPPRKGRKHILRLIRDILFFEPKSATTNISIALDEVNRLLKRRSIVFLLSDFLQETNGFLASDSKSSLMKSLSLTNQRHDMLCFNVYDIRERELPDIGTICLEDSETGETLDVNTSNKNFRQQYEYFNTQRLRDFKRNLAKNAIDMLEIDSTKDYIKSLKDFFEKRRAKR